jgi:hypothetical protein
VIESPLESRSGCLHNYNHASPPRSSWRRIRWAHSRRTGLWSSGKFLKPAFPVGLSGASILAGAVIRLGRRAAMAGRLLCRRGKYSLVDLRANRRNQESAPILVGDNRAQLLKIPNLWPCLQPRAFNFDRHIRHRRDRTTSQFHRRSDCRFESTDRNFSSRFSQILFVVLS